jgi:hypothetical protein
MTRCAASCSWSGLAAPAPGRRATSSPRRARHGPSAPTRGSASSAPASARRLAKEGHDPLAKRARVPVLTFRSAAEAPVESKRSGRRSAKHAAASDARSGESPARWRTADSTACSPNRGSSDASAEWFAGSAVRRAGRVICANNSAR